MLQSYVPYRLTADARPLFQTDAGALAEKGEETIHGDLIKF